MLNPVDFDSFFKIVGGVGILSLISQFTSFFKTIDEMKTTKNVIEGKRTFDTHDSFTKLNFPSHVENDLAKTSDDGLKKYFNRFFGIVTLSVSSVVWYAITKNVEVLSTSKVYLLFISLCSYSFLIIVPLYFLITIYTLFSLYYRLIDYKNDEDLYNRKK
jgi:hypothetical protein